MNRGTRVLWPGAPLMALVLVPVVAAGKIEVSAKPRPQQLSVRLAPLAGGRFPAMRLHKNDYTLPAFFLLFHNTGDKLLRLPSVSEYGRGTAGVSFEVIDEKGKPMATIARPRGNVFPTFFELEAGQLALQPFGFTAAEWKKLRSSAKTLPSSRWKMRAIYNGVATPYLTIDFHW